MTKATLDAMMAAVTEAAPLGRRALKLQARAAGKTVLHPADLFAPAPAVAGGGGGTPFDEGVELVAAAVGGAVDPSAAEIVRMMASAQWIEASVGPRKSPGAYCTGFPKLRQPRVYMSAYTGSATNVSTLAHELGHAYHSWVRFLPSLSPAISSPSSPSC